MRQRNCFNKNSSRLTYLWCSRSFCSNIGRPTLRIPIRPISGKMQLPYRRRITTVQCGLTTSPANELFPRLNRHAGFIFACPPRPLRVNGLSEGAFHTKVTGVTTPRRGDGMRQLCACSANAPWWWISRHSLDIQRWIFPSPRYGNLNVGVHDKIVNFEFFVIFTPIFFFEKPQSRLNVLVKLRYKL